MDHGWIRSMEATARRLSVGLRDAGTPVSRVGCMGPIGPFPPVAAFRLVSWLAFDTKITSRSGLAGFLARTCAGAIHRLSTTASECGALKSAETMIARN